MISAADPKQAVATREANQAKHRVRNIHLAHLSTKLLVAMAQGGGLQNGDSDTAWRVAEEWYDNAQIRFTQDPIPMED